MVSLFGRNQHSIVKQLSFNEKFFKEHGGGHRIEENGFLSGWSDRGGGLCGEAHRT